MTVLIFYNLNPIPFLLLALLVQHTSLTNPPNFIHSFYSPFSVVILFPREPPLPGNMYYLLIVHALSRLLR